MRHGRVTAAATGVVLLAGVSAAQPPPPAAARVPPTEVRALLVRYHDGRTTTRTLSDRGRVNWTPTFPRVPRAETSREGLPLFALQFEEALDGDALVVTLALLYGTPPQRRMQVASVRLMDEQPVRVSELETYGVRPVTLSLVRRPAPTLHLPAITSVSSLVDAEIDADAGAGPGYRIRVTNRAAQQAVMSIRYRGYRGTTVMLSARPRGTGDAPLIMPGATYELRLPAVMHSAAEWVAMDRFEITSVLWDDGLVEGDPKPVADARVQDAAKGIQLARAIALLRASAEAPAEHPLAVLRASIVALPIAASEDDARRAMAALPDPGLLTLSSAQSLMASSMQLTKNALLNDVDEFARSAGGASPSDYAGWLRRMVAKFDAWRHRSAGSPR